MEKDKRAGSDVLESIEHILHMSESDQRWLAEVESIVPDNIANSQFNTLVWAQNMHLSEIQQRRKVKFLTGLALTKYIQLARLKHARKILDPGGITTVAKVSCAVGFDTTQYFSKLFKAEYGRKPVEYYRCYYKLEHLLSFVSIRII